MMHTKDGALLLPTHTLLLPQTRTQFSFTLPESLLPFNTNTRTRAHSAPCPSRLASPLPPSLSSPPFCVIILSKNKKESIFPGPTSRDAKPPVFPLTPYDTPHIQKPPNPQKLSQSQSLALFHFYFPPLSAPPRRADRIRTRPSPWRPPWPPRGSPCSPAPPPCRRACPCWRRRWPPAPGPARRWGR